MKKYLPAALFSVIAVLMAAPLAFAHEAYVLPAFEFRAGLKVVAPNPLAPLVDPRHLKTFIFIGILVALSYAIMIIWSTTRSGFLIFHNDNPSGLPQNDKEAKLPVYFYPVRN